MTKENCLETDSKKLMMMQYFRGEYAVVTAMNPGRLQDIAEQNLLKKMEDYQKSQDQLSRGKVNAKK